MGSCQLWPHFILHHFFHLIYESGSVGSLFSTKCCNLELLFIGLCVPCFSTLGWIGWSTGPSQLSFQDSVDTHHPGYNSSRAWESLSHQWGKSRMWSPRLKIHVSQVNPRHPLALTQTMWLWSWSHFYLDALITFQSPILGCITALNFTLVD